MSEVPLYWSPYQHNAQGCHARDSSSNHLRRFLRNLVSVHWQSQIKFQSWAVSCFVQSAAPVDSSRRRDMAAYACHCTILEVRPGLEANLRDARGRSSTVCHAHSITEDTSGLVQGEAES